MTIIGIARPIGQPALSQDDTLALTKPLADRVAAKVASGEISDDEIQAALAIADQIASTRPPCTAPWCDPSSHPNGDADLDPGVSWHRGAKHVITGTAGDVRSPIELNVERFDAAGRPGLAYGYLYAEHEGSALTAAELRELAAVALSVADRLDAATKAAQDATYADLLARIEAGPFGGVA